MDIEHSLLSDYVIFYHTRRCIDSLLLSMVRQEKHAVEKYIRKYSF